ncbi:MAG TPA: FAD-dependent oxidoreductase [Xanthobacteraceae bacterium]|jgi:NADH dehydrogenase FAD-containing subunit
MNDPNTQAMEAPPYDVVIMGAGYAGLMAALRLGRRKRGPHGQKHLRVALVNGSDQFIERVRLQERIAGPVAARIASIATLLAGTGIDFICGNVVALDPARRRIRVASGNSERELAFDRAIYALGSQIELGGIPGADAHAYRLEAADGPRAVAALRERLEQNADRAIRVIVVGGHETAIEAAGEIKTRWPAAKVTMLARSRCAAFKGARVERAIRAALERLDVKMIDGQTVAEVRAGEILTGSNETIPCDLCVWSGGLRAPNMARQAGLSTDPQGRIWVDPGLRSISHPHIIAVGDAAHPIAPTGARYRMSAYAALVSGAYAADAILAMTAGRQLPPFCYSAFGQGVAIGRVGVGFATFPDDREATFLITGRNGIRVRNFFVRFLATLLKMERRFPGLFFTVGRKRVSWQRAQEAMQAARAA